MNNIQPDYEGYAKAVAANNTNRKKIEGRLKQEGLDTAKNLRKKFNIPEKQRAKKDDILKMLTHALETGDKGKVTIEAIAKKNNKNEQWIKDVSGSSYKKLIGSCLTELEEEVELIKLMKKHATYHKDEITCKKLVVALNKVIKQRKLCLTIESLKQEIKVLKQALKDRPIINNWKPEAISLRKEGLSYGKIANRLGKHKSTVSTFFLKQYK